MIVCSAQFLTSMLGFFPAWMAMPAGLIVSVLFTMFILIQSPYLRALDGEYSRLPAHCSMLCLCADQLMLLAQVEIMLLLFVGMVMLSQGCASDCFRPFVLMLSNRRAPEVGSTTDVLLSTVLIVLTVCVFLAFAANAVLYARRWYRAFERRQYHSAMKLNADKRGRESSSANLLAGDSSSPPSSPLAAAVASPTTTAPSPPPPLPPVSPSAHAAKASNAEAASAPITAAARKQSKLGRSSSKAEIVELSPIGANETESSIGSSLASADSNAELARKPKRKKSRATADSESEPA